MECDAKGLPDNVWNAADDAVTAINDSMWEQEGERCIAWGEARMAVGRAILAERKRCAEIARRYDTLQGDYIGHAVADRIEAGK